MFHKHLSARKADRSRNLIERYFGSISGLLNDYIKQLNIWHQIFTYPPPDNPTKKLSLLCLKTSFHNLYNDLELRNLYIWNLNGARPELEKKLTGTWNEKIELFTTHAKDSQSSCNINESLR